jgi:hypothetical protein
VGACSLYRKSPGFGIYQFGKISYNGEVTSTSKRFFPPAYFWPRLLAIYFVSAPNDRPALSYCQSQSRSVAPPMQLILWRTPFSSLVHRIWPTHRYTLRYPHTHLYLS